VHEIHGNMEGAEEHHDHAHGKGVSFAGVIIQIVLFDIVFSLDSVITAVGMAQHIPIMITAVVLAMIMMMFASGAIGGFVNRHPTIKMLALAFLLLIGVVLVAEGFRQHVSKAYIYFAMAFSFAVEMMNLRMRAKRRKRVTTVALPEE
jgi:predicted tellurium resistance membrane protein TerC